MTWETDYGGAWGIQFPISVNSDYYRTAASIRTSSKNFIISYMTWYSHNDKVELIIAKNGNTLVTPDNVSSGFELTFILISAK